VGGTRSTQAVLLGQPQAASTCGLASRVPHTIRGRTRTRRRQRTVLPPWAERPWGRGIPRGWGRGPGGWRRAGWPHGPKWASHAVVYALKLAVRKRDTQPGASPGPTCWTTRCARASVRSPPSMVSRRVLTGARATPTQEGERDRRLSASACPHLAGLARTEQGIAFVHRPLRTPPLREAIVGEGLERVGRFDHPPQHGMGIDREHAGYAAEAQAFGQGVHGPHQPIG
jgi:hypothetical protein